MNANPEDLRRHYASLSDDALRAMDRTELVEIAQQCYDKECSRRGWRTGVRRTEDGAEAKPDWLDEGACACSFVAAPGNDAVADADDAREALEAGGVPCYIVVQKVDPPVSQPQSEYA